MLRVIFSLDYEIHGNGDGDPQALLLEPTNRLLRQFDDHGARLVIFAEMAELLKFREYRDQHGVDRFHIAAIAEQLRRAVQTGHDVQPHIHPSYFNARFDGDHWVQDWTEYDSAGLPYERIVATLEHGCQLLRELLAPLQHDFYVFRAGNWAMQPTSNISRALLACGLRIDSSVYKGGTRSGLVSLDYTTAPSALEPWPVDLDDVCKVDPSSPLWEYPIYCEMRWLPAFVTINRIKRVMMTRRHKLARTASTDSTPGAAPPATQRSGNRLTALLRRYPWKADFNQCSGRQLIAALERAWQRYGTGDHELPFVLIGHSKQFDHANQRDLDPFLAHIRNHPDRFSFGLYPRPEERP